jgi:nucleoid DNA-binding protein
MFLLYSPVYKRCFGGVDMPPLTIGKIVKSIRKYGLTIDEASNIQNAVVSELAEALASERKVKLEGLGTFEIRRHSGRKIKSIKTKVIMETRDYKHIVFSPCAKVKKALNTTAEKDTAKDVVIADGNPPAAVH